MISIKKALIGAAVTTSVVAGAGLAWANWSGNASGAGTATARTAQVVTITAATSVDDLLYPGFTQGDVDFTLSNTNPYPITFTGWSSSAVSSNIAGCTSGNVTLSTPAAISIAVPAGASNQAASIDNVVTMIQAAPDACQGAVFTITLALTGMQTAS